jgi:dihydrofolate reductase
VRKVVLYTLMSLDGAVDDPGGYFSPESGPGEVPELDDLMIANEAEVIEAQDTVLLGRTTYDEWSRFWPSADYQPFADFINGVQKYVVTSTPLANGWQNAEAVDRPVGELVRALKARAGGDIGVHASIRLAQSLLAEGLVDELRLVVGPVVGCPGRRLLADAGGVRRLELLSAVPTPSGGLLLRYRVPAAPGTVSGTAAAGSSGARTPG